MPLIGYARLDDATQDLRGQLAALVRAGCRVIHAERAPSSAGLPPRLERVLTGLGADDVLVVADRHRLPAHAGVMRRLAAHGAILRVVDP